MVSGRREGPRVVPGCTAAQQDRARQEHSAGGGDHHGRSATNRQGTSPQQTTKSTDLTPLNPKTSSRCPRCGRGARVCVAQPNTTTPSHPHNTPAESEDGLPEDVRNDTARTRGRVCREVSIYVWVTPPIFAGTSSRQSQRPGHNLGSVVVYL